MNLVRLFEIILRFILKVQFRNLFLICLSFFLSGCLGGRYLKEDEKLLYRNKFSGNEEVRKENLEVLLQQKPNRRIPIIPFSPYVYIYQFGENHYDREAILNDIEKIKEEYNQKILKNEGNKKKQINLIAKRNKKIARKEKSLDEGNIWMRWGEQLTVFDSLATEKSVEQMRLYLNSKGYFHAEVDYTTRLIKKYMNVTYHIQEGGSHKIDTLFYDVNDTTILALLKENQHASLLSVGKNYDADLFASERDRVDNLVKDNGYYDFSKQYVQFNIDTTLANRGVAVETIILDPVKREKHKVFTIDSVVFVTDANITNIRTKRKRETFNGIVYKSHGDRYSKRIMDRRVFVHPGSVYSKENTFETQRQLANLDMFKFINVYYDTTGGKTIANITTSALKKYQTSNEIGLTVIQGGLPGPFYNVSLKNRNIFGGMEIFELSARVGIEGVASATSKEVLRSREYGGNASLIFPQFLFPLGNSIKSSLARMNPRTRLLLGYTHTDRPEYNRDNFKSSITYSWQKQQKVIYSFTLADINLINSEIKDPEFAVRLEQFRQRGNQLYRSFQPSYVSSSIFTTTFNFNQYGSFQLKNASFLKFYLEGGGTTLNFTGKNLLDTLGLQSFQFVKTNVDFRRYLPGPASTFAYRVNIGFAKPYGENKALPYEKYFFAGGSNSIRAWRPRRLGPGSYTPQYDLASVSTDEAIRNEGPFDYRFEQPGDIILETSFEWRRNLIGFFEGAIFVDAGNIWQFNEVEATPGGKFELKDFYKEIAVGTGIGLRLDFSFLLVRFDIGTKVYDPAREEGDRFVLGKFAMRRPYGPNREPLVYNIGIGYPF